MGLTNCDIICFPGHFKVGAGTGGFTVDAEEEHGAYVFQVPKTGTLKKVGWRCYTATSPNLTLKVSLETVASTYGTPVATTNAAKTLYAAGAESANLTSFTSQTTYWTEINGSTGVTVTKGDFIAVTFRVTAYTSGSIAIVYQQYSDLSCQLNVSSGALIPYIYTYLGGAAANYFTPFINFEYESEILTPMGCMSCTAGTSTVTVSYNSTSNPDRRGLKFSLPYGCRLWGCQLHIDQDAEVDVILYDSDEYTVMSGFPITLDADLRRTNSMNSLNVLFPIQPTLSANTWYRLVVLPKTSTNIGIQTQAYATDGSLTTRDTESYGAFCAYTTFNGAPSSGSHVWTDDDTKIPFYNIYIDQIDIGASGGGGAPRFGDMTGGLK